MLNPAAASSRLQRSAAGSDGVNDERSCLPSSRWNFDPTQLALTHDSLNDQIFAWHILGAQEEIVRKKPPETVRGLHLHRLTGSWLAEPESAKVTGRSVWSAARCSRSSNGRCCRRASCRQ